MGFDQYHEPPSELSAEARTLGEQAEDAEGL